MPKDKALDSSPWKFIEHSSRDHEQVFVFKAEQRIQAWAPDNQVLGVIWQKTVTNRIDDYVQSHIKSIKVTTIGSMQPFVNDMNAGSWSWYELVILDRPDATDPKLVDGRPLVWVANTLPFEAMGKDQLQEKVFHRGKDDVFNYLKEGDHIAIRVCARFSGWKNNGTFGALEVRLAEDAQEPVQGPEMDALDLKLAQDIQDADLVVQNYVDAFLGMVTPSGASSLGSSVNDRLSASRTVEIDKQVVEQAKDLPLRLLAFDGGGVRGVASLYILQAIMDKIPGSRGKKPYQVFDMICGTSTGGLIAIMLGRLKMGVDECIIKYKELAEKIFAGTVDGWIRSSRFKSLTQIWPVNYVVDGIAVAEQIGRIGAWAARHSEKNLENAIKTLLKEHTTENDENAKMYEPKGDGDHQCHVFVLACRSGDIKNITAEHIRTYAPLDTPPPPSNGGFTILEAARATSAAPTYFPPLTKKDPLTGKDIEYLDAGLGFNNPVMLLLPEARFTFGARPIGCLVSIGTGMSPKGSIPRRSWNPYYNFKNLFSLQHAIVDAFTSGEQAHKCAEACFGKIAKTDAYFRFNPGKKHAGTDGRLGTDDDDWETLVDLGDYTAIGKLQQLAQDYINIDTLGTNRLERCAERLRSKLVAKY